MRFYSLRDKAEGIDKVTEKSGVLYNQSGIGWSRF
jgi:hypothetical protein